MANSSCLRGRSGGACALVLPYHVVRATVARQSVRSLPMHNAEPVILLDPYPRPIDLIFSPQDKARLERLGRVLWHDGAPAAVEHIEQHLPTTVAIIGQTPMPRERLERAPQLQLIANVESNCGARSSRSRGIGV